MDPAEQLRILERTKGHAGRLALATVDLVHGHLKEEERARLKVALNASAVPHWVDEQILAALLAIQATEALRLRAALRNLNVVESFPARGERAVNVHEATRKALRKLILDDQPETFQSFSNRARQCFVGDTSFHGRIEALYHLFAVDQHAAALECWRLDNEATVTAGAQAWQALAGMLTELLAEKWLRGRALLQALLSVNECRLNRGEVDGVEDAAQSAAVLAEQVKDLRGGARAHILLGDLRILQRNLKLAFEEFDETRALYERAVLEDPQNLDCQRERNVSYSRLGDVLIQQEKLDDALAAFRKSLAGSQAIISTDPNIAGVEREMGVAHSKIGDVLAKQRDLDGALAEYHEHRKIAESLVAKDESNTIWQRDLGNAHSRLGDIFLEKSLFEEALAEYQHDLLTCQNLVLQDPTNADWRRAFAIAVYNVGIALFRLGRHGEAVSKIREAVGELKEIITLGTTNDQWAQDLQNIQATLEAIIALEPETPDEDRSAQ